MTFDLNKDTEKRIFAEVIAEFQKASVKFTVELVCSTRAHITIESD